MTEVCGEEEVKILKQRLRRATLKESGLTALLAMLEAQYQRLKELKRCDENARLTAEVKSLKRQIGKADARASRLEREAKSFEERAGQEMRYRQHAEAEVRRLRDASARAVKAESDNRTLREEIQHVRNGWGVTCSELEAAKQATKFAEASAKQAEQVAADLRRFPERAELEQLRLSVRRLEAAANWDKSELATLTRTREHQRDQLKNLETCLADEKASRARLEVALAAERKARAAAETARYAAEMIKTEAVAALEQLQRQLDGVGLSRHLLADRYRAIHYSAFDGCVIAPVGWDLLLTDLSIDVLTIKLRRIS